MRGLGVTIMSLAAVMVLGQLGAVTAGEIHDAAASGDADRVAELLKADPGLVNAPDENDQFSSLPLHLAAANGHVEVARLLLESGAEIDCGDSDESTPLHVAALNRQREMVDFLLRQGADVNRRDRNGAYALSFAASGGDSNLVEQILAAGADLNYWNEGGITLLHFVCSRGLHRLFDLLVERGDDLNAATNDGQTPLHWAALRGNAAMVEALLDRGADPSPRTADGETPLSFASFDGHVDVARLLLARGADVDEPDDQGHTQLLNAAWRGNVDFAQVLIDHGADVNSRSEDGEIVLVRAVMSGEPDLVAALIAAGANPNVYEKNYGRSALHLASLRGDRAIAEHLLKAGAPVGSEDHAHNTPLELAARYGHGDVVELLVAYGADQENMEPARGTLAAQGELTEGEAVIWYLGHSGWAIKTRNHLLVFDYFSQGHEPAEPGLCNGHIQPSELAGESVTVFATHEHGDHFDPLIFDWREAIPNVTYVLGCQPEEAPAYEYTGPREERVIDGIKVSTIESNDTGVGYVVEVDGLVLFHAGDHANRQRDFSGPYRAEIDYLADRGVRPDIAFMPITGCGFGDQEAVKMGVHYALETLKPRVFMPMHAGQNSYRYHEFIRDCKDQFTDIQMEAPENRGDHFRYRDGRVS